MSPRPGSEESTELTSSRSSWRARGPPPTGARPLTTPRAVRESTPLGSCARDGANATGDAHEVDNGVRTKMPKPRMGEDQRSSRSWPCEGPPEGNLLASFGQARARYDHPFPSIGAGGINFRPDPSSERPHRHHTPNYRRPGLRVAPRQPPHLDPPKKPLGAEPLRCSQDEAREADRAVERLIARQIDKPMERAGGRSGGRAGERGGERQRY